MGLEFFTNIGKSSSASASDEQIDGTNLFRINRQSSNFRLFTAFGVFILYLIFGAIIFSALESNYEEQYAEKLRIFLREFMLDNDCVTYNEMDILLKKVIDATQKGVSSIGNVTAVNNWGFGQSFFFSGTLVTTVGYGHVSPNSQTGKFFTIVYCIFGIPMFLIVLGGFVERLKFPLKWLLNKMTEKLGGTFSLNCVRFTHLGAIFAILLVFMFLIPAAFFEHFEDNWTYLDSFYYCFVSLTTIGLGDYIPGDDSGRNANRAFYKIIVTCYLMVGILCMMLFMSVIHEIPQLHVSRLFLLNANQDGDDSERVRITDNDQSKNYPNYTRHYDESVASLNTAATAVENSNFNGAAETWNDYYK